MHKLISNVMLVIGMMSAAACTVEETPEESGAVSASTATDFERPLLVFEKKPFWTSWDNFCEALDGMEIRTTIGGCTTAQTYTNCSRGTISGTCHCDVSITRTGYGC